MSSVHFLKSRGEYLQSSQMQTRFTNKYKLDIEMQKNSQRHFQYYHKGNGIEYLSRSLEIETKYVLSKYLFKGLLR